MTGNSGGWLPFTLRVHGNARAGIVYPPRIRSLNGRNSPSWGDCSLSADLTADEIPAAGGHQRFVPPHGFSSRSIRPALFRCAEARVSGGNPKACYALSLASLGAKSSRAEKPQGPFSFGKPRPRGEAPRYDYSRGSAPDAPSADMRLDCY